MARVITWLHAYVERCIRELDEPDAVIVDEDGDFPFRSGTAAGWVRVLDVHQPMVRVWAHAAHGLKGTAALLREVNDINLRATSATVAFADGTIMVSQTLLATAVDHASLQQARVHVGTIANDIGALAAAVFDGETPYEPEPILHDDGS